MADLDPRPVDRREHVVVTETPGYERRERITRDLGAEYSDQLARAVQLVWLAVGALEFLLGLRVVLKLLAANPNNPFANFVYNLSEVFLWPFFGLTVQPTAEGMILEIPTLIAMAVYALFGWLLVRLLWLVLERPRTRSASTWEEFD